MKEGIEGKAIAGRIAIQDRTPSEIPEIHQRPRARVS